MMIPATSCILKKDEGIVEFEVKISDLKCFMENGQPIICKLNRRKKLMITPLEKFEFEKNE